MSEVDFSETERQGLYKAIYGRRDVRAQFKPDPIPDKIIVRLLDAAHHAPSVGFSQPWNFILIKDPTTKSRVKELYEKERVSSAISLEGPKRSRYLSFKLEGIMEAPVNMCVTYDQDRFGPFVIGRSSIPETGVYSVCCAIQNLWLAARAEGIGVGWVSILKNEGLRSILNIPQHAIPVAYLCLGYVTHFPDRPDLEALGWLPRIPLEEVVYLEMWGERDHGSWPGLRRILCEPPK